MPKIDTSEQKFWRSTAYMVRTPPGTMFVHIMEDKLGEPVGIQINIGKAGSEVLAWAYAVARLCSCVLDRGGTITDLLAEISGIATDKSTQAGEGSKETIRSGVQGLESVLRRYHKEKYAARIKSDIIPSRMAV